jgi:hypothetical protein
MCQICKREVRLREEDGRTMESILIDGNGVLMCPNCYVKYGKAKPPQTNIIIPQKKQDWGKLNFLLNILKTVFGF